MPTNPHVDRFRELVRSEHRELRLYVATLCEVADAVGEVSLPILRQRIGAVRTFLSHQLIPHAQAEDQVIYPLVARMLGTLEGTSTMLRDHVEIGRFTDELAALEQRLSGTRLKTADAKAVRRVLYGLSALLRLHLEQEDVYLGLLDAHLTPEAAPPVLSALEDATRRAQERIAASDRG